MKTLKKMIETLTVVTLATITVSAQIQAPGYVKGTASNQSQDKQLSDTFAPEATPAPGPEATPAPGPEATPAPGPEATPAPGPTPPTPDN